MEKKVKNSPIQNKRQNISDDVDDLKQFIDKNIQQKHVLKKILSKININKTTQNNKTDHSE